MRQPVAFIPHGGGPWPLLDLGFDPGERRAMLAYMQSLASVPSEAPRALLVISAHWEEAVPTLLTTPHPPLLFDYFGFPQEAYSLSWPAPCATSFVSETRALLQGGGFTPGEDNARGYDHGVFVALKAAYPNAEVPVLQLSLVKGLDPDSHLRLGKALAPLRDAGVFILGTGNSYHNLRSFGRPEANAASEAFDAWLQAAMALQPDERNTRLANWAKAPCARDAHPREEHLLPLMVAAGAAHDDVARLGFSGSMMGKRLSGFHFDGPTEGNRHKLL